MPAIGHVKEAVIDHLIPVLRRSGALERLFDSKFGEELRSFLVGDDFAFGAGITPAAGAEPWTFDGTRLRLVADINPGAEGSEVIAITWVGGRAFFVGFDGRAENLYAYDPILDRLTVELAGLSDTARGSQIALSADRFLVITTADPGLTENRKILLDTESGATRDLLQGTAFEDAPYTPVIAAGDLEGASYFAVNGAVDGVYDDGLFRLDTRTGAVEQVATGLDFEQSGGAAGGRVFFAAREADGGGALGLYSLDSSGNLRAYPMPEGALTGLGGDFVALGDAVYFRTAERFRSDIYKIGADGSVTLVEDYAVIIGTSPGGLVLLDLDAPGTNFVRIAADGTRADFAPLPDGQAITQDYALASGDLYYTTYDEETLAQRLYRLDTATGAVDLVHAGGQIDIRAVADDEVLLALQKRPDCPTRYFTVDGDDRRLADFERVAAPEDLRFGWDLVTPEPDLLWA